MKIIISSLFFLSPPFSLCPLSLLRQSPKGSLWGVSSPEQGLEATAQPCIYAIIQLSSCFNYHKHIRSCYSLYSTPFPYGFHYIMDQAPGNSCILLREACAGILQPAKSALHPLIPQIRLIKMRCLSALAGSQASDPCRLYSLSSLISCEQFIISIHTHTLC